MKKGAELGDHLSLSFKTHPEQDSIAFLWDTFETKCTLLQEIVQMACGQPGRGPDAGMIRHIAAANRSGSRWQSSTSTEAACSPRGAAGRTTEREKPVMNQILI